MTNYKPNQLLEVEWLDAETVADWVSSKEAAQQPKAKFKTVGYYTNRDNKYLYLSWSIGLGGNQNRAKDSIPLGCIEKIRKK